MTTTIIYFDIRHFYWHSDRTQSSQLQESRSLTYVKHCFGLFRQWHIVYAYGKVKGVGEVDGPVHRIYRTVSDVEQGGCVVEAQVPRKQYKDFFKCSSYDSSKIYAGEYLGFHTLLKPQLDKGFQVLSSSFLLPSLLFFQKTGPIFLLLKLETKKILLLYMPTLLFQRKHWARVFTTNYCLHSNALITLRKKHS